MKIEYSLYSLFPKNNKSIYSERKGALLKVEFENHLVGYADCHPWPEWGDKPIEEQLENLKHRHTTPLTRCSLKYARLDAEARHKNESLFIHKRLPISHFLVTDFLSFTKEDCENIEKQGFTHLKIKLGNFLAQEIAHLLFLFKNTSLKLRLDFNEKLSLEEYKAFLNAIEPIQQKIDFIEDPIPFDAQIWKELRALYPISLACDKHALAAMHWPDSADILVVKPAIENIEQFERVKEKVIITSYLDHPLGQLNAALIASELDINEQKVHGLLSHHSYQENSFSSDLAQSGPFFSFPYGTGLGFDEKLSKIKWHKLNEN